MLFIEWLVALVLALAALTPQETPTVVVPPTATATLAPAPTATPEPVYGVEAIICSFDWPCAEALLVVYGPTPPNSRAPIGCPNGESTGDPLAHSTGDHRGLFQLASVHAYRFERRGWTWDDAFDAYKNAAIAHELWSETRDWRHWSCRP